MCDCSIYLRFDSAILNFSSFALNGCACFLFSRTAANDTACAPASVSTASASSLLQTIYKTLSKHVRFSQNKDNQHPIFSTYT